MGLRDIVDDNDEIREIGSVGSQPFPWVFPLWFSDAGTKELSVRFARYPYTYPFDYATGEVRDIGDPEG